MDIKQAVQTAKERVGEIFAGESIVDIGPEEVEFDESNDLRAVAVGFSRFWSRPGNVTHALGHDSAHTFKIVRIEDKSGRVQSVKHRDVASDG